MVLTQPKGSVLAREWQDGTGSLQAWVGSSQTLAGRLILAHSLLTPACVCMSLEQD